MKRHEWLTGLASVATLIAASWFLAPAPAISFDKLSDAWTAVSARGFYCRSDFKDGAVIAGFMVSREPTTWEEANLLFKCGKMSPAWRGKVWITCMHDDLIYFTPDDAAVRVWGDVCAFGDEKLLNEIEAALRHRCRKRIDS